MLAAFRQRYSDTKSGRTAIEKCEVSFEDDPSQPECRLLVRLICRHGVLKTYKLTYEEVDLMAPVFDRDLARNRWTIGARLMMEYMVHFGPKAEQFDISSDNGRASFTSFTEKVMAGKEILKMAMHTNIALDTADFERWDVEDRIHIAVSLKDVKAIVTHAGSLNASISTFYSDPGRPLQVAYEHDGMKCEFTLMTMADVRASQTFATVSRAENRPPADPASRANSAFVASQRVSQRRDPSQSQQPPDDEPLFRGPTPSFQTRSSASLQPTASVQPSASAQRTQISVQPSASAQRTQIRPPSPPSPPAPPRSQIPPSQPMTQGLFLPFDSDEDSDDELAKGLDDWDEPMLRWDSGGNGEAMPNISVVRDQVAPHMRDQTESADDDDDDVVGPTQEVSQVCVFFVCVVLAVLTGACGRRGACLIHCRPGKWLAGFWNGDPCVPYLLLIFGSPHALVLVVSSLGYMYTPLTNFPSSSVMANFWGVFVGYAGQLWLCGRFDLGSGSPVVSELSFCSPLWWKLYMRHQKARYIFRKDNPIKIHSMYQGIYYA